MKVARWSALRTGRLYPQKIFSGTYLCYTLSRPQRHSASGRIMSMKNSIDTIGNRSRDLPVCSAVPRPLRHRVPRLHVKFLLFLSDCNETWFFVVDFPNTNFNENPFSGNRVLQTDIQIMTCLIVFAGFQTTQKWQHLLVLTKPNIQIQPEARFVIGICLIEF
jgi:hypothetical protein